MAYIEENMKSRREGRNPDAETKEETIADPNDAVPKQLPDSLKVAQKAAEEGNVTNSLAMLTAIPEVDLGMEYVLCSIFQKKLRIAYMVSKVLGYGILKRQKRPNGPLLKDAKSGKTPTMTKIIWLPPAVGLYFHHRFRLLTQS